MGTGKGCMEQGQYRQRGQGCWQQPIFSTEDICVAQQSTVQRQGGVLTGIREMRTSSHPSSHHTSLKATTDLSCPVQGSLLLSGMGSLASICPFMHISTPFLLESRAHVPTCKRQGPHALNHTGCQALRVPFPVSTSSPAHTPPMAADSRPWDSPPEGTSILSISWHQVTSTVVQVKINNHFP